MFSESPSSLRDISRNERNPRLSPRALISRFNAEDFDSE